MSIKEYKTFNLSKQFDGFIREVNKSQHTIKKNVERNAKKACVAMVEKAKSLTPNSNDGKRRGANMISNRLVNSWVGEYKVENGKFLTVTLTNLQPYATFVQKGHKVKKHFVPWLYISDSGYLSYEKNHNQPLFGLTVGVKAKRVEGVDMIGPSIKVFEDTFNRLNKQYAFTNTSLTKYLEYKK